jgi:hypothetical protein
LSLLLEASNIATDRRKKTLCLRIKILKTKHASAHIPCALQAGMAAKPHGICVIAVLIF